MDDTTDTDPRNEPLPVTVGEWAKLHRLLNLAPAHLSKAQRSDPDDASVSLSFSQPVPVVVKGDGRLQSGTAAAKLTLITISSSGLHLTVFDIGADGGHRRIRIDDVVSIEQAL